MNHSNHSAAGSETGSEGGSEAGTDAASAARTKAAGGRRDGLRARVRAFTQRRWVRLAGALFAAVIAFHVVLVGIYRFVDPPSSNWMIADAMSGRGVEQTWVPLEEISPHVLRAVVASEDARFCQHWGVDWREVYAAVARADARGPRGASTISMQTTKNLFLWEGRSYVRKAIELPLTWVMEAFWPKRRILEVYLNIAEWGPGIYGIEAAAQFHFRRSASRISPYQARLLAAALPNPVRRTAGAPGPRTSRLAARLAKRARIVDVRCAT
ncbi:MAG: monofunctional biosynthetic peptidoglycan transglycosylase [Pseudomonadota bacterium]